MSTGRGRKTGSAVSTEKPRAALSTFPDVNNSHHTYKGLNLGKIA